VPSGTIFTNVYIFVTTDSFFDGEMCRYRLGIFRDEKMLLVTENQNFEAKKSDCYIRVELGDRYLQLVTDEWRFRTFPINWRKFVTLEKIWIERD